jgi:hypothetical protein
MGVVFLAYFTKMKLGLSKRKVYKVLVGKPEGKRPLGRPRRRWEDGIRIDLRDIGLGGVDWVHYLRTGTSGGLL